MDMIVFSGQSNMQGQTRSGLALDKTPVEGACEYRYLTDNLVPLAHPVGESIEHTGEGFGRGKYADVKVLLENAALLAPVFEFNMVPSFCKSYIEKTGREVVAVHTAKGSTQIEYWLPGNPGYTMLKKKVNAAMTKIKPERVYFVWLQGESDAIFKTSKGDYKRMLLELNAALKADFSVEKFGMILVGQFTDDERDFEIINAQKEICEENDDFLMLTTITEDIIHDERFMNPEEHGHYDVAGQELIGTLAGEALGKYAK